jgi:chromosome segregation ATPase
MNVAEQSSKFQRMLLSKLDEKGGLFKKANFFDSLKETDTETMQRRVESRRHPMTGISGYRSKTAAYEPSQMNKDMIKNSHKLNPRILETWLNNTVSDAEDFELPSSVLKQENKLPLVRYGIDRSALLNSGLPSIEVDRLYQSLFVHSIGFYQLILKVLEHTDNKYSIVTGIWKVFAILLEYCCQLDYQMIITTLNLEKREELEQLENEYKARIILMEENEKNLLENISSLKQELKSMQKDLQKEIEKREELEDELLQRGSGHEEEVSMRLLFESKLNQMYAKQRDLTTKVEQLTEVINDQQKNLEMKNEIITKEKKKANDMIQAKIEIEQEMKRMEEKQKQLEVLNNNLESRVDDCGLKIEFLSNDLSKANMNISEYMNEIAQKKIIIDDQKFEIDVCRVQLEKLESFIKEYAVEKEMYTTRIAELEKTYTEDHEKNKFYEQEYAQTKELETLASGEYKKYKARCEQLEVINEALEIEKGTYKVSLDTSSEQNIELNLQVKRSQEKIEEMNRGRRIVEEANDHLKSKLNEKIQDLQEARHIISDQKTEIDQLKSHESELETELTSLNIKLKSLEKQFETTKETLLEKINNLNDILTSEKKIRENWIYRYEEEQKTHSKTTKELIETEDKLNDANMKINSLTAIADEKSSLAEKYTLKNKELFEEILNLKSTEEELSRKNKTLNILLSNIDVQTKEKINDIYVEIDLMKKEQYREIECMSVMYEEVWHQARHNLEIYENKSLELEKTQTELKSNVIELEKANKTIQEKNEEIEGKHMVLEELHFFIGVLDADIQRRSKEYETLRISHYELTKEHQNYLNKIPVGLRGEKNPFIVLEDKIKELQHTINEIMLSKQNVSDQQTQYIFIPDQLDKPIQTDITLKDLENAFNRPKSSKNTEKIDQYVQSSNPDIGKVSDTSSNSNFNKDFPLRKKLNAEDIFNDMSKPESTHKSFREPSVEYLHREEEIATPVNLKSIYKHEEESEEAKHPAGKLPAIIKKHQRPPSMPLPLPSEIKRHIKQANSRRKNDVLFS